ncbi:MAG TPA: 16S rRNA (guanine(966)-N(2))-methyltransferase RsmD [Rhodopila sp.]|nr:16S rRNA (guanine(966)-N(2))-methyltransferase RsmD [Rhodopila sp.]
MRIVGGAWRGRTLTAPPGQGTRPTADRVRQALFDMLIHAPWGGRQVLDGAVVLDVFAGTGALGLEALSRGAASAYFIENDSAALRVLRANVTACGAAKQVTILAADVLTLAPARMSVGAGLVFLDPPYGHDLVPRAILHLRQTGYIAASALAVAETARDDMLNVEFDVLAERNYGVARVMVFRLP